MIIHYTVPEIWHVKDVIFIFHFGLFFVLLLANNPKNQNFEKNPLSFYTWCTKNYDHTMYSSRDMVHNKRADGWREKVAYKGGCPTQKWFGTSFQ